MCEVGFRTTARHGGSCPQYRVEAELVLWELTPCCRASECLDLLHPWHKCEGCAGSHWCAASTPQVLEFAGPVTAHQSQQHTRPWQSSLPPPRPHCTLQPGLALVPHPCTSGQTLWPELASPSTTPPSWPGCTLLLSPPLPPADVERTELTPGRAPQPTENMLDVPARIPEQTVAP